MSFVSIEAYVVQFLFWLAICHFLFLTFSESWHAEVKQVEWVTPDHIKQRYPSSDILPGNRVVFNHQRRSLLFDSKNSLQHGHRLHPLCWHAYRSMRTLHAGLDKIDAEII